MKPGPLFVGLLLASLPCTTAKAAEKTAGDPCPVSAVVEDVSDPEHFELKLPDETTRHGLHPYDMLPGSAEITFLRHNAWIDLRFSRTDDRVKKIRSRQYPQQIYPIPGNCSDPDNWNRIVAFLSIVFQNRPPVIMPDAIYMGGRRSWDSDPSSGRPSFKRLEPLAYKLEADRPYVFAAWQGAPGALLLLDPQTGKELARGEPSPYARSTVALPDVKPGDELDLVVEGETGLRSSSRRIGITEPGTAPPVPAPIDGATEAVRAAWLLYEGPEEWRLQALAILESHREADFIALLAWRSAVTDSTN